MLYLTTVSIYIHICVSVCLFYYLVVHHLCLKLKYFSYFHLKGTPLTFVNKKNNLVKNFKSIYIFLLLLTLVEFHKSQRE